MSKPWWKKWGSWVLCVCARAHVSLLCKYNRNLEQRIYIWLENCWTLFYQKLSKEMMVLSVWPGKQMMKYGLEETWISKTQKSLREEVINEDVAYHFLWLQGYHSPQCYSTRPVNRVYYVECWHGPVKLYVEGPVLWPNSCSSVMPAFFVTEHSIKQLIERGGGE